MAADNAKYGGYQEPICFAIGENINGTVIIAPINPKTEITVIDVGLFLDINSVSLTISSSYFLMPNG